MIINTNIKSGENSFSKLSIFLKELDFKTPLVLVDKNLYENSNYVKKTINEIIPKNLLFFYDYSFEPSYQMLDKMMNKIKVNDDFKEIDVIVGIGGGSAMDTAKGIAVLLKNSGAAINYKGFPEGINKPLPVICIPSTTGTGSEVVYNASFIDEESKIKMGINYIGNYPKLAILDPLVPSTAPMSVLASSGCDALVHSLESFMSIKSNEQVRFFSKQAYNLIISNMIPLLKGHGDLSHWQNMQWAAVYAMFALSNSTSGPTGALSYYLGANFKVNHGIAGGVFIGNICRYNHDNKYFDLSQLYEGPDKDILDEKSKSSLIIKQIDSLLNLAKIPKDFGGFGVNKINIQGFNDFASQVKVAMDFNPVHIDSSRISELFIKI
jgi:alcohol dehydrogenase